MPLPCVVLVSAANVSNTRDHNLSYETNAFCLQGHNYLEKALQVSFPELRKHSISKLLRILRGRRSVKASKTGKAIEDAAAAKDPYTQYPDKPFSAPL